ncbi:LOW QUALITY PROTEIN: hypothetical protein CVT26_006895 [Gymnopilus dilepis]|uniref:NAD(P)-binding protein n=1 Tax=Gymnopilus dilepis TaxID=231916 RepID=A0A409W0Z9_9AGAR|nr:LOW QUALITY PROTEIN: hypothetical protein CVT26_006895 [Gymnopilus dilepis]
MRPLLMADKFDRNSAAYDLTQACKHDFQLQRLPLYSSLLGSDSPPPQEVFEMYIRKIWDGAAPSSLVCDTPEAISLNLLISRPIIDMGSQGNTLVWLITGAGSGLGYQLALEALSRSDKVIATGRSGRAFEKLEELKEKGAEILELDVTASLESLQETAKKAIDIYGRVDVLVNNAAYVVSGTVEEIPLQATQDVFNTNLFGALNVTKGFLPYMRENKVGTVVWIGSIAGRIGFPSCGSYVATKWALRGISATLQIEVASLGLRTICVDLGWFRTCLSDPNYRVRTASTVDDYRSVVDGMEATLQGSVMLSLNLLVFANGYLAAANGTQAGDPARGARVLVDVVRGEGVAKDKPFPPELVLGTDCYDTVKADLLRNQPWRLDLSMNLVS